MFGRNRSTESSGILSTIREFSSRTEERFIMLIGYCTHIIFPLHQGEKRGGVRNQ